MFSIGTNVAFNVGQEGFRLGIVKRQHSVFGIHRMGEYKMFASMKRLLSVLGVAAALAAFAGPGNATTVVLCIDGGEGFDGCVADIPTAVPALSVASDGESGFSAFGTPGD